MASYSVNDKAVAKARQVFDEAVTRWATSAPRFDLTGQPYAFCRQSFLSRNPVTAETDHGGPAVLV
jgi:hypothetical protein